MMALLQPANIRFSRNCWNSSEELGEWEATQQPSGLTLHKMNASTRSKLGKIRKMRGITWRRRLKNRNCTSRSTASTFTFSHNSWVGSKPLMLLTIDSKRYWLPPAEYQKPGWSATIGVVWLIKFYLGLLATMRWTIIQVTELSWIIFMHRKKFVWYLKPMSTT